MVDLTLPIARTGEQQFGVLCRQRSGIDSGTITPVARVFEIEKLCDRDQRDICLSALTLAEMVVSRCKEKNRNDLKHWVDRIARLTTTTTNGEDGR